MSLTQEQIEELGRKLDPANVKQRPDSGMSYIEAWHAIAEANRIFGHAEWSSETVELKENCPPTTNQKGNTVVSFRAKVRVTVNGSTREGVGFGSGIARDIHAAYEGAIKEAESDARKRALMTFGWPFGLALYDKEQKHVGVEEQKDWKKICIDLENKINDCTDNGSLTIFQETNGKFMEEIPVPYCDTVSQLLEQRAREIHEGLTEKWPYRFYGTDEAWEWFQTAGKQLLNITTADQLKRWNLDNYHIIEGLSILKAKKYECKETGRLPKERIQAKVNSLTDQLTPVAAE